MRSRRRRDRQRRYHIHHAARSSLKPAGDEFWVNHISGYEHNLWPRYGDAVAADKVGKMVARLSRDFCAGPGSAAARPSAGPSTLLVVPYYGGVVRNGNRTALRAAR